MQVAIKTTSNILKRLLGQLTNLDAKKQAIVALCLILPAPLLGITASLYLPQLGELQIGQAIWLLMKVWLIAMPVLWLLYIDRGKLSWSPTTLNGIIAGFLWSIPVAGVIFGVYLIAINSIIDTEGIKTQIEQFGLSSPAKFWIFAGAISLGNALMEEYVWRWFVFTKCKALVGVWGGILLSAFFFTVHHVIVVWNFGDGALIALSAIGIFSGGVIWAWLYNKYNSIWPGWICHIVADTAIMWIAWWIITN